MNSFGTALRLTLFGESHGPQVGIVIDGIPAGTPLSDNAAEILSLDMSETDMLSLSET